MQAEQLSQERHEDPRIVRSRLLILDAAAQVFVRSGYEATTMDEVAAVAGVVKRTVYNIFADKDQLFVATLSRSIETAETFLQPLTTGMALTDPDRDLPQLAVLLARSVLIGPVVPLRRLLVGESTRFPELAAEYRRRAPEAVITSLAQALRSAAARGLLDVADPELAAEHFAFLVMGADLDRGMLTGSIDRTDEQIRSRAVAGADVFLRAYARR